MVILWFIAGLNENSTNGLEPQYKTRIIFRIYLRRVILFLAAIFIIR